MPRTVPPRALRLPEPHVARCEVVLSPAVTIPANPYRCHLAAAGLILLSVVLRLVYLVFDCPPDLAPDEAHYWHWSRHLDWSYYSKGPLVAWLIRASCEVCGGSGVLAVRLPALFCHAALLAGWYVLASGVLRSPRAGLAVVTLALTLPPVSAGAVLMTIDAPFLACWCWALVGVWKAVAGGSRVPHSLPPPLWGRSAEGRVGGDSSSVPPTLTLPHQGGGDQKGSWFWNATTLWWLFAGVCAALGVLAKYPMLLLPVAVGAFLVTQRRCEFRRPGFWLFVGLTFLALVPILVWNANHDWVSIRHVFAQADAGGVRLLGLLGFAAGQFGLLLGFWFVAFVAAGWQFRRSTDTGLSLAWWASVPVWGVFLVASIRGAGQVNWPVAAYIAGLVLAVAWVREQWHVRWVRNGLIFAVCLGLGISFVLHFPATVRPVLASLTGSPTEKTPAPIRKLDPMCRLLGWRILAAEVDAVRDRVTQDTGRDPVLAGMVWTIPGELAFYCRGHPEAYSFGSALADRHSQYDLWRPNPVADAQAFRGRSFVYVGDEIPTATDVFERVEPPIRVVHTENGVPVAAWTIWVGHGFKGFANLRAGAGPARY